MLMRVFGARRLDEAIQVFLRLGAKLRSRRAAGVIVISATVHVNNAIAAANAHDEAARCLMTICAQSPSALPFFHRAPGEARLFSFFFS
jgi:hypothetical protein